MMRRSRPRCGCAFRLAAGRWSPRSLILVIRAILRQQDGRSAPSRATATRETKADDAADSTRLEARRRTPGGARVYRCWRSPPAMPARTPATREREEPDLRERSCCLQSMSALDVADGCPMNVVSSRRARGPTRLARGTHDYSGDGRSEPRIWRDGESEPRANATAAEAAAIGGEGAATEKAAAGKRERSDGERHGANMTKVLHGDIGMGKRDAILAEPAHPDVKTCCLSTRLAIRTRSE
jgi:hypothetical protein